MGKVNRFLQLFLNYGLVAAILVWAATVALMAYHLKESPWRWAFILLSLAGIGTIGVIFWIRNTSATSASYRRRAQSRESFDVKPTINYSR